MGKKSDKGRMKKERRRAAAEAEAAKKAVVHTAMFTEEGAVRDVLVDFPAFCKFSSGDLEATLTFSHPDAASEAEKAWMFELVKTNMKEMYLEASWGWDDGEKMRELVDEAARYVIVRDAAGTPVAFAHFRFMLEGMHEVLYLYELQVEESAQRKGLGRRLMQVLELIAGKHAMKWVMLTVFTANEAGMAFYGERMKYAVDEISPSRNDVMKAHTYEIMSKCIDRDLRKAYTASAGDKAVPNAGPTRRASVEAILKKSALMEEAKAKAKAEADAEAAGGAAAGEGGDSLEDVPADAAE